MAVSNIPASAAAPQPGLRSFIVYDEMPDGCFAFVAEDRRGLPHVRPGDIVIVDPSDTSLQHGEMFLIEFDSGRRQVIDLRSHVYHHTDGSEHVGWMATWNMPFRSLCDENDREILYGDGPYYPEAMERKLVGKIVGFFEPDFRRQLKLAA